MNNKLSSIAPVVAPLQRGRRTRMQTAMALVGTMLVLMLVLAVGLIGVASSGRSSGDMGSTSNNMLQMAKLRIRTQKAETIADAGFRASVQWISDLSGPPINVSAFTPKEVPPSDFFNGSGPVDSGKWTVVNFPEANDPTKGQFKVRFYPHKDNATATERQYLVEVVGMVEGTNRVVRADIRQRNFAQYAYFTDNLGPGAFVAGRTPFNGPVHINNSNGADLNVVWKNNNDPDTTRLFQWDGDNTFTMWGRNGQNTNKVKWHKDELTPANVMAPTSDSDWKSVITPKTDQSTGAVTRRTGPKFTDDPVPMPKNSNELRDAALGGTAEAVLSGKPDGVYVPSTLGPDASTGTPIGGVYIAGAVNDMVLEAAGPGNRDQIIHVYQDNDKLKYTLRMNADGVTTVVKYKRNNTTSPFVVNTSGGYPKAFAGAPTNGVVYSREDIGKWSTGNGTGGLSGTIANSDSETNLRKLTICTRIEETGVKKTINIDGNIKYANADIKARVAPKDAGVLGIVAGYMKIVPNAKVVETDTTGFEKKDAAGAFIRDGNGNIIRNPGHYAANAVLDDLSVHGTLMSYNDIKIDSHDSRAAGEFILLGGYIAKIGSSFGTTNGGTGTNALDVRSGFQRILSYDKRVANQPPPYFPGTGQAYEIVSYQRILKPLYD